MLKIRIFATFIVKELCDFPIQIPKISNHSDLIIEKFWFREQKMRFFVLPIFDGVTMDGHL